jgi:hypothetical protein
MNKLKVGLIKLKVENHVNASWQLVLIVFLDAELIVRLRRNLSRAGYFSFLFLPQKEKKQKKSHRSIKNPCFLRFILSRNPSRSEAHILLTSLSNL